LKEVSFCVSSPAYPETDSQAFIRRIFLKRNIDINNLSTILEKEELTEEDLTALQEVLDNLNNIIKENKPQDEAAREEPPKEGTPENTDTSAEEDTKKEEIKQEILVLIDTLFEIEKENLKEETNE
jgi:hypothetical protein